MSMLAVEKITKRFGGLVAVNEFDFFIRYGEILGLIGPNGAGKTTLFNCICGYYKPYPGAIIFKGENIAGMKPSQICRKGVARTFQLVEVFPDMTVLENIVAGILFGKSKRGDQERIRVESMELVKSVGLSGKEDVLAKDLTFNDKKSVELARALATGPELILLDELVAGLNPVEMREKIDFVKTLRSKGISVFWIEHVMKAIMEISDRVIVIHHGEKIADGKPKEIAEDERVINAYLGEKYTF